MAHPVVELSSKGDEEMENLKMDVAETVRQSILACEYGKAQQKHGPGGGPFVVAVARTGLIGLALAQG